MLKTVNLDGKISQLFVVDIPFNNVEVDAKTLKYNEKKNPIDTTKRPVFQLGETLWKSDNGDGNPQSCQCTKKTHATMLDKEFVPLYLKSLFY